MLSEKRRLKLAVADYLVDEFNIRQQITRCREETRWLEEYYANLEKAKLFKKIANSRELPSFFYIID